jgi:putative FmdB family regulatory protein
MPMYEYKCGACGHEFEDLVGIDAPNPACPACGEDAAEKLISNTSFQLKGSGWYVTDYADGGPGAPSADDGAGSGDSDSTGDSGDTGAGSDSSSSETSDSESSGGGDAVA